MSPDGAFLCDAMCGKLAVYLRMCGYDTAYALERGVEADDAVLALARREDRTLLTRDRELAARAGSVPLTERAIEGQLRELHDRGVRLELAEPTRCGDCNGRLARVDPAASTPEYAPDPRAEAVWRCRDCGQCFWTGSHWERVEAALP